MANEQILSSAAAQNEITKKQVRKNELADLIETRKKEFETAEIEKRDALLTEIEGYKKEADTIDTEIAELEERKKTLEAQEKRYSVLGSVQKERIEERNALNDETDPYDTKEYRAAYVNYVRTGDDSELRALGTNTTNVPIPTIVQGYVETAWEKFGKFSRLCSETQIKGILDVPYEKTADEAGWHDEGAAALAEENITFGQVLLQPRTIKKWISLTDELLAMSPEEFLRYIVDELVYRVIKLLDEEIIIGKGNGGKGVIGVVGNALTIAATAKELSFNTHNELLAELVDIENAVIFMNPKTFLVNIMGMKDDNGRPIYQVVTDNTGKVQRFIGGNPVEFTNALKPYDTAAAGDVYMGVGNFTGYRLNYPEGKTVRLLLDPYTKSTEDVVREVARLFVAGNITRQKHFATIAKPAAAAKKA